MYFQRKHGYCICNRNDCCSIVSLYICCYDNCCSLDSCRSEPLQILMKGDSLMKIVVVRSPKALRGILKFLFGINRQENTV